MQQMTLISPPSTAHEYTEACAACGEPFLTSDPDRKHCDDCLVDRINGAGILEDGDGGPGLFDEPPPNRTPIRARVICLVCSHEARIPILRGGKVCDTCMADLPSITARIESELNAAEQFAITTELDLFTAIDDAHESVKERYSRAVALRESDDPRIAAAWAKALAANDGLSLLLRLYDAQLAASQALTAAIVRSNAVLPEIAKVQQ